MSVDVAQCWHKTHLGELAELHYSLTLKCKGISSFRRHLVQQRRQSHDEEAAREFHVQTKLKQCWNKWLQRCEHNEEIALGMLTRKARCHVAARRTREAMVAWIKYVVQCRHSSNLKQLAECHFRESTLPKYVILPQYLLYSHIPLSCRCFQAFRENVAICLYKRELTDTSEGFRR